MGLRGSTGERPTFHDLRHTFAVLAIASGMDVETLARILGHANASMTLDIYGDALHSAKQDAINELEAYLAAVEPAYRPSDAGMLPGA